MSTKGKLAEIVRKLPIGVLFRALVGPLLKTVGGFWGKIIAWFAPKVVDRIEEKLDTRLEKIEQAEKIKEAIDVSVETGDQRTAEEHLGHPSPGAPARHTDGVQTRPSRERD